MRIPVAFALIPLAASSLAAQTPRAIATDPPRDAAHPARFEVLHIPSGGVKLNGIEYVAAGAGAHPTVILFHGLPGNEKNLDLAQAIRRAGWNVVAINYRGSWGSPGAFRFAGNLQDADATLAFVHDPANARALAIDPRRIILAGHSMGGWVTVLTAAHHPELLGAILISAADMKARSLGVPRDSVVADMAGDMESLAGVTPASMADELRDGPARWRFDSAATGLSRMPLLVLTADDGLADAADRLVRQVRALGNTRVTTMHEATDHGWSDRRIALETAVLNWLSDRTRSVNRAP